MKLLQRIDDVPVAELAALFDDVGPGENGFGDTPVHRAEMSVEEYVVLSLLAEREQGLPPGRVPQTLLVPMVDGQAAGLFRVRHRLNDGLRRNGGHVGYYTRPKYRRRGIARRALAEALDFLRELGEPRALVTIDDDNAPSIAVAEACGGVLEDKLTLEGQGGVLVRRYWIDLRR